MESDGAESGVVGIWEGVDDGVKRVTTDRVVVIFCSEG
jgi:hypothetical protein